MRIALGRTRIWGKVEESILRRSLGRRPYCNFHLAPWLPALTKKQHYRPTFAISSLFLNSPLTSVTFPFISNSVHRNRSSFVALDTSPRPMLNVPSVSWSISGGPGFRLALLASAALLRLRSKSLRNSGRLLVDAARDKEWREGVIGVWIDLFCRSREGVPLPL